MAEKITPDYTKKLPEAEFEVMNAIWNGTPPVNTAYLMEAVGKDKGWKAPTLISFLVRLQDRGYISSEKKGKERYYTPVAERDARLKQKIAEMDRKKRKGYKAYADEGPKDNQMNIMMYSMLGMVVLLGLRWPTTMSLYWACSSLVNILKTIFIQRRYVSNEKI